MDFGAFMDLFHNAPVSLGAATPPAALPNMPPVQLPGVGQDGQLQIQAPHESPLAALGKAFQSNGQDPGLSPLPTPQQHRSAFLMNILPQLMQSIGQGNMLGRMGSM